MSEKHLTELPWKTLATKQKIKDPGLGKALAAYGKAGEDDPEARLKALEEIESQADDLQKEHKKNKDVADYLGEVLREADKTRKALESQKDTGGEEDDGEAEEYKKDLKKKMVGAMTQVKGRAPGATEPGEEGKAQLQFMAYVASGASAVIVGRKVGGATKKLLPEIAGGASGGKYIRGECIFEKNVHTFVVEKVPGGLAKKLSKALLAETGIKYKVRVRSLDGAQETDSDIDTDTGADEIPAAPPPPPPATGLEAQWKQLKAALYPEIKKALEANPPNRDEILKLAAEASKQEKTANFQAAIDALTKLRPLLGGTPPPAPATDDLAANFKRRLQALAPNLQRALKEQLGDTGKIRAVAEFAREKAGAGNFKAALQALDALEKLLAAAGIAAGTGQAAKAEGGGVPPGIVAKRKFLLERWKRIPGELHAELAKLETSIAAQLPQEDAAELVGSMEEHLQDFTDGLQDEIDAGINSGDMGMIKGLKARVAAEPLMAHLLKNPFVAGSAFETVLISALTEIEGNLAP